MRSLVSATQIAGVALLSRATLRVATKAALLLLPVAVALVAEAAHGQSALDGVDATPPAQAINFSTCMRVQTGDNVGIGGFIITGTSPKRVLVRALGPSLTQFGLTGVLVNPELELHGPGAFATIINDEWRDSQQAEILATGLAPTDFHESAIVATLDPGAYTAIISGLNNSSGVGLVEVYDLDQSVDSKLANISTRAFVSTSDNIVIAGFSLGNNSGGDSVVVRGIGPSLAAPGVANALADPILELRDGDGTLLVANNDWRDDSDQARELVAASLAPTNDRESGIAVTLPPGLYTALLAGRNSGVGVGLVEVYDRGAPSPVGVTITRMQTGNAGAIEKQHVAFDSLRFAGTFRISVYKPSTINHSDIGARAALHGQTAPISFTASAAAIVAAIKAVPNSYYAYGQLGNLEFGPGAFSYFASQGANNRDPIVTLDAEGGIAAAGFTIEFGSLVGSPPTYNTWVAGMPLITIAVP